MKSYEIKYTKGHLVDTKTGKRILLKRGGTFNILGDDDQFEERDELHIKAEVLKPSEKLASLQKRHKGYHTEKIADMGQSFVYRIGLSKRTSEDKAPEFLFDAIIREDLYIRSQDGNEWTLCDCYCETKSCLEGEVQMIETVQGLSLNNLFSNMVAFYFPLQRSGTCNAFDTFYFCKQSNFSLFDEYPVYKLHEVKNGALNTLHTAREEVKKRYAKYKRSLNL